MDIDLTYLSLKPRREALQEIHDRLIAIKNDIEQRIIGSQVSEGRSQDHVVKLLVSTHDAIVKIEPNLILRGSVHKSQNRDLCLAAQEHFETFVSVQTLSMADLYGGKLCAALDRQHPRDLFDVQLLFDDTGITPEIRRAFVVYIAGHNRPMSELLAPRLQDIGDLYVDQLTGMTRKEVPLDDLRQLQRNLAKTLVRALDDDEKDRFASSREGIVGYNFTMRIVLCFFSNFITVVFVNTEC